MRDRTDPSLVINGLMSSVRRTNSWPRRLFDTYLKNRWSPLLIHSMCLCASVHLERTARSTGAVNYPSRSLEQLYYKGLALKAVQTAISKPLIDRAVFDAMILSISMLAIHDDIQEILVKDYNPFNPPLTDLQGLDFYGFISFHPVHWTAVQDLIVRNGGFHTIKLFGAPWMLS